MNMSFPLPTLMLVTDRSLCGGQDALVRACEAAVAGGVNAVQLREKDLPSEELLPLARRLREVTAGRALLLVNGPLDVALACDADGVLLPEQAAMIERPARPFLVGRSVHSLEAALRAEADGVDYLIAGPVYETRSHPGMRPAGFPLLKEISAVVGTPLIAIGGITSERLRRLAAMDIAGIAVTSAVLGGPSPRQDAHELRAVWDTVCGATWKRRWQERGAFPLLVTRPKDQT